ncbi:MULTISPECIES: tetratricopeptide repeat protein [Microbacterium]|uniref:tetratricopeptide repeat protein n=1 Tax=Microbacterium TaxID=33882 RepID=UPI001CBE301C|nr:tetratricopeptide repeat protein [Microbacterium sp. OVT16B]
MPDASEQSEFIRQQIVAGDRLRTLGERDSAIREYARAVEAAESTFGQDHPATLEAAERISETFTELRRPGDALMMLTWMAPAAVRTFGVHSLHADRIESARRAAVSHRRLRRWGMIALGLLCCGIALVLWEFFFSAPTP